MITKEKALFIDEIKINDMDPYKIMAALLNAIDPDDELTTDDFFDVLEEGNYGWELDVAAGLASKTLS